MASFNFNIPPDFIKTLGKMADVERLAPAMLDAAAPILERNVKSEAMKHRRTGDMANSIKKKKAAKTKSGGYFVSVRPTGRDRKGVRNMEKMVYAEYGTSKQAPTPMLTKATEDSTEPCLDAMQEVFNREVGG